MATLNAIHARMNRELAELGGRIDAVFFCPHGPDDGCRCRKPLPGLFDDDRRALRRRRCARPTRSAIRCATCRPASPPAARRTSSAPARARALDDAALARGAEAVPHAVVHADLAGFAQQLIQRERHAARRRRRSRTRCSCTLE